MKTKITNCDQAWEALANDQEEGLAFYIHHLQSDLLAYTYGIVMERSLAQEIVADTFLKLWLHKHNISDSKAVAFWLFTTCRNAAIDHLRKKKRLFPVSPIEQAERVTTLATTNMALVTEQRRWLEGNIEKLPPKCRKILQMCYIAGKENSEVAKELGLSPHTVRNQKIRALRLLRKIIEP